METQMKKRFFVAIGAIVVFFLITCAAFAVPQFAHADYDDVSYPPSQHDSYKLDNGLELALCVQTPGKGWTSENGSTAWVYQPVAALVKSVDEQGVAHYIPYANADEALGIVVKDTSCVLILADKLEATYDFTEAAKNVDEDGAYLNPFIIETRGFDADFSLATVPQGKSICKACEVNGQAVFTISM